MTTCSRPSRRVVTKSISVSTSSGRRPAHSDRSKHSRSRWSSTASAADAVELQRLRECFERSEWAGLRPLEVETEIDFVTTRLDGREHVVICKLDAVYRRGDR